jgi:signal transduction histidine kinase
MAKVEDKSSFLFNYEFGYAMIDPAPKECKLETPAAVELSAETALRNWRRRAVDAFMVCSVVVYLPGVILLMGGYGPPITWTMHLLVYTCYSIVLSAAFFRIVNHRIRLYVMIAVAYFTAIAGVVAYPGPFMRALPVALPIIGLVLAGVRFGRLTTMVSVLVILFTPLLTTLPVLTRNLRSSSFQSVESAGLMLVQGAALTAMLLALTVLLERFHGFLENALIDQHRAATDIERKVFELTQAHNHLASEMDERRKMEREVTRIADEEKRRLGIEIHDGVCQQITGALLRCEALARRVGRNHPLTANDIAALSSLLEEAIDEAHGVARGLCPLELRPDAIEAAMRTLTRRMQRTTGVQCHFIATGDVRIPNPTTAHHLYRIAQEAVSNAVRHARAHRIKVELHGIVNGIRLQVEDDGDGLPRDLPSAGMGLRTMACRAHLLDGEFTVTPAPKGGTRVCCLVPHGSLANPDDRPDKTEDNIHGQ